MSEIYNKVKSFFKNLKEKISDKLYKTSTTEVKIFATPKEVFTELPKSESVESELNVVITPGESVESSINTNTSLDESPVEDLKID
jgi:hypothetical protein